MTLPHHIDFGRTIEARAAVFLTEKLEARILAQNYRCRGGEIDLILEQESEQGVELVFVEIRARSRGSWVSAIETVTRKKRLRIHRAIRQYLSSYRGRARSVRLDVLGWDEGKWTHLENVWD